MAHLDSRSPAEWYREAVRRYIVDHQACAACAERHCVFRSESFDRIEYYCSACGFSVCHEHHTAYFIAALGDETEVERAAVNSGLSVAG